MLQAVHSLLRGHLFRCGGEACIPVIPHAVYHRTTTHVQARVNVQHTEGG